MTPEAERGAERAKNHADSIRKAWSASAFACLTTIGQRDGVFMTEDVRIEAERDFGLPPPPDRRAWGAVILKASRAGLIRHLHYAPAKTPNSHGGPKSVWGWVLTH